MMIDDTWKLVRRQTMCEQPITKRQERQRQHVRLCWHRDVDCRTIRTLLGVEIWCRCGAHRLCKLGAKWVYPR